jgi:apolipoprotein N-acyltransferase
MPATLLAATSGIMYFLAFPGVGLWPLSFAAFVPLLVAFEGRSSRECAWLAAFAGFAANLAGFCWLSETIHTFGGQSWLVAFALVALLAAYQAGRMGLFGWLYGRARVHQWPQWPVACCAFVASELAYPLLLPWNFSACVHGLPALCQSAEIGGPIAVGLTLLLPNLAIAEGLLGTVRGRRISWRYMATGLAVPLVSAALGMVRIRQFETLVSAAPAVRVGLVQGNRDAAVSPTDRTRALDTQIRLSMDLQAHGVDFIVWSEGAIAGILESSLPGALAAIHARGIRSPLLAGATLFEGRTGAWLEHNSAVASDADGRVMGHYDKHRLLPFGESIPLGTMFPSLYERFSQGVRMVPGRSFDPIVLAGHRVAALICYEDALPSFVNEVANRARPEMLVNLTNDSWFGSPEPWIHLALAQSRAIEHRRYLMRATQGGVTAVIDPMGRATVVAEAFRATAIEGRAHWMASGPTGYELWGDLPWWAISACAIATALRRRRMTSRASER